MTTVALIPARGGSKGIPRKNLQLLAGRPLVVHSIEHAKTCARIDRVFVSTDDDEIARVSVAAGAELVRRPAALASDTASTESAIVHALSQWRAQGLVPTRIVLLQATSPFRSDGQLDRALVRFETLGCDSMLSVAPFHGFLWRTASDGTAAPMTYDPAARPRRQDMQDIARETGSFYVFTRVLFERTGARLGGRMAAFEVPPEDALDIDDPEDLALARAEAARRGLAIGDGLGDVEWLVLDVDGTLTDGAMYYGEDGAEHKRFDTRDGAGLGRWRAAGGRIAFITGENSRAVVRRAEKLGVDHVVLGCTDKRAALEDLCRRFRTTPDRCVAMGDDLPDLGWAGRARVFAAPADARPEVRAAADLVTQAAGGHGAVRELVDRLLAARQHARKVA